MQSSLWGNILKYGMLALCVSAVVTFLRFPIGSTTTWWLIKSIIFLSMFMLWDKTYRPVQIILWMVLVLASCVAGTFFCRDYWDWKHLVSNVINYSICVAAMLACVPEALQKVLSFLYKHIWVLFFLFVFFLPSKGIAKFLLPFTFLALFYPLLNSKYSKLVWLAFLITIIFGIQSRSDVIRFLFCLAIGIWSIRHDVVRIAKRWYWVFFLFSFVLFTLAAKGKFNVFKIGDDSSLIADENNRISTADTRTMLYEEVISTVLDRSAMWFGCTPARGYYSEWMIRNNDQSNIMGDMHYGERGNSESSVLNVFLHFGIIGIVVYLLLFWRASFLGIFRANNRYVPVIGLYVAFRFMMGWVEDFTSFDMNMFLLWTMIGICYSPYFREMTDDEFEEWIENMLV